MLMFTTSAMALGHRTVNSAEKSMLRSSLICRSGVSTLSSCCTRAARRLPERFGGMLLACQ